MHTQHSAHSAIANCHVKQEQLWIFLNGTHQGLFTGFQTTFSLGVSEINCFVLESKTEIPHCCQAIASWGRGKLLCLQTGASIGRRGNHIFKMIGLKPCPPPFLTCGTRMMLIKRRQGFGHVVAAAILIYIFLDTPHGHPCPQRPRY